MSWVWIEEINNHLLAPPLSFPTWVIAIASSLLPASSHSPLYLLESILNITIRRNLVKAKSLNVSPPKPLQLSPPNLSLPSPSLSKLITHTVSTHYCEWLFGVPPTCLAHWLQIFVPENPSLSLPHFPVVIVQMSHLREAFPNFSYFKFPPTPIPAFPIPLLFHFSS